MTVAYPIGVVDVVYGAEPSVPRRSELARDDGFSHIDVVVEVDPATLALPVGCPTAYPKPIAAWCSTPAPYAGDGAWDQVVRWFRNAPEALCEPWGGAVVHDLETMQALREAVPGVRFLIDTGHATAWGGDLTELLPYAAHVQLRDARRGATQAWPGDGEVDFAKVFATLDACNYDGVISIEYFDLPDIGWPLQDPGPREHAQELLALSRGL